MHTTEEISSRLRRVFLDGLSIHCPHELQTVAERELELAKADFQDSIEGHREEEARALETDPDPE